MEGCHAGFPDLPIQPIQPVHVHQALRSWHYAWQRQRLTQRLSPGKIMEVEVLLGGGV